MRACQGSYNIREWSWPRRKSPKSYIIIWHTLCSSGAQNVFSGILSSVALALYGHACCAYRVSRALFDECLRPATGLICTLCEEVLYVLAKKITLQQTAAKISTDRKVKTTTNAMKRVIQTVIWKTWCTNCQNVSRATTHSCNIHSSKASFRCGACKKYTPPPWCLR